MALSHHTRWPHKDWSIDNWTCSAILDFMGHLFPHLTNHDALTFYYVSKTFRIVITSLVTCIEDILHCFTNSDIVLFHRLQSIYLVFNNHKINDTGLQSLVNVKRLHTIIINGITCITDAGLCTLTGLHRLELDNNTIITDKSISQLTKLQTLSIRNTKYVTDASVSLLTNLKELSISGNNISPTSLTCLQNLTSLCVGTNALVNDNVLRTFTRLIVLDLEYNKTITNNGIIPLNLTSLNLHNQSHITDVGIAGLTQLSKLWTNKHITNGILSRLTCLTCLFIGENNTITANDLSHLTNLRYLRDTRSKSNIDASILHRLPNLRLYTSNTHYCNMPSFDKI